MSKAADALREALLALDPFERAKRIVELKQDTRKWAQELAAKLERQHEARRAEALRLASLSARERTYWQEGMSFVAGVDEVGRGPLAGPVVAAAVILPPYLYIPGVKDSKLIAKQADREALAAQIKAEAIAWAFGVVSAEEIDRINIAQATAKAMRLSVQSLKVEPEALLIDGLPINALSTMPQKAIIDGDALSHSIAAAAIVAKVERDQLMDRLAQQYPVYGWESNKGYGSADHIAAIKEHGLSPLHRKTFCKRL